SYVLRHAKARGVVVESQLVPRIEAALASAGESGSSVRDVFVARGLEASWSPPQVEGRTYVDFEEVGRGQSDRAPAVLVEDRDPVSYLYTSGTTAAPKGVVGT
ncbi:AMP-binding protein, partial [Salmonella enterica]|uniref:AMP-binding protein n=1 Tax=Salmonella enterica TaxID=28901 RepID=UPI001654A537